MRKNASADAGSGTGSISGGKARPEAMKFQSSKHPIRESGGDKGKLVEENYN
jgi:hypothetical protein